jgi:hypothetical protein
MTRPSKREIESDLGDLAESSDGGETHPSEDRTLVHEDPDTGEWYDDAELTEGPLDKDSTDPLMVLQETVIETGYDE